MISRADLITIAINAGVWANAGEIDNVLDVLEPIIRQSERREAQLDLDAGIVYRDLIRDDVLADLRAKVNALEMVREGGLIRRGDVLALLKGDL